MPRRDYVTLQRRAVVMLTESASRTQTHSRISKPRLAAQNAPMPDQIPKPSTVKSFQVPDTRLPFINGEIAQVNFQNQPHLVSGIWGNANAGGRIYFWNPLTGTHAMRMMPKPSPGVYMLQTGPDGKLYLGDGRCDLYRY